MLTSIPATRREAGAVTARVRLCPFALSLSKGRIFLEVKYSPSTSSGRTEGGFTLLEMLVALAIFSLAGLALVRLQAVSVRTAADLDTRVVAAMVARNIAYERLTDPTPPARGDSEGDIVNAGRSFRWQQTVEPTDDDRIVAVTVKVTAGPGQSPAVLTVTRPAT
jgi:general secretion pathway protein I